MEKIRQRTQVNRNTEDRTLYSYKTVPIGHVRRVPYKLLGMSEQCCGRRLLTYSVVGAHNNCHTR